MKKTITVQPSCNRVTDKIRSFTDHIKWCLAIPNACETRKEERFLTI